MYITKMKLENIRCFDELEIDFGKRGSSILVLGDNGDGKSTVLKCLAMGLCDESSASALFRELPGEFIRRDSSGEEGIITVDLDAGGGVTYCIVTRFKSLKTMERVTQTEGLYLKKGRRTKELNQDTFPWDRIFVSGYGPGIRIQGTADFQHYLPVDAVYPLFRYDVPLQNPELVIRRLVDTVKLGRRSVKKSKRAKDVLDALKILLSKLLELKRKDSIRLTATGIEVKGHWGRAELGELGDGYRSVITLVLDLISWWFLKCGSNKWKLEDIRGIVLIDEIEQHLHPRWQRTILQLLQDSFPYVQFISTTHSPLVASGSKSIDVHILQPGRHLIKRPYGWLADDVYSMMGLENTRSKSFTNEILEKYEKLYQKKLKGKASRVDRFELKRLRGRLSSLPESDPVSLTTEILSITNSLRKLKQNKRKKK